MKKLARNFLVILIIFSVSCGNFLIQASSADLRRMTPASINNKSLKPAEVQDGLNLKAGNILVDEKAKNHYL